MSEQEPIEPQPEPQQDSATQPPKGKSSARGGRGRAHHEGGGRKREEEGEKREKKERREGGGRREREEITLETVIPEKPKKSELLKEPNKEEYEKKYDEFTQKIDSLHKKFHNFIQEMKDNKLKNKDKTQANSTPLKEVLKTKLDEKKRLNEEFRVGKELAEKLKADLDSWVLSIIFLRSLYSQI